MMLGRILLICLPLYLDTVRADSHALRGAEESNPEVEILNKEGKAYMGGNKSSDVLVFIAGPARTFLKTYESQIHAVIEPLGQADVFVYLTLGHDPGVQHNPDELVAKIKEYPSIVGFHVLEDAGAGKELVANVKCRRLFLDDLSEANDLASSMRFHRNLHAVGEMLGPLEEKHGKEYKYVAFLRPELLFPPNSALGHWTKQPKQLTKIMDDWALFMPRSFAESAMLEAFRLYSKPCKEITAIVSSACKKFPSLDACDKGIEDREGLHEIASAGGGIMAADCAKAAYVPPKAGDPCNAQLLEVNMQVAQVLAYFKDGIEEGE
jgi:hypothetical protein